MSDRNFLVRRVALCALASLLGMMVFNALFSGALKYWADPNLTLWLSSLATILFGTLLAACMLYMGFREYERQQHELKKEIAERKRSEASLRQSEESYRRLFEEIPEGLYRTDCAGRILDANPALVTMLGFQAREALREVMSADLFVEPKERERETRLLAQNGIVRGFEIQLRKRDGNIIWVRDTVHAVRDAQGTVECYEGSLEDITDRKHAEEALRQSEQKLSLHVEKTPLAVIEWDPGFRVVKWNLAAETLFGYSAVEAIGRRADELIIPKAVCQHVDEIWSDLLAQKGGERSTNENVTKDGRTIFCEWYNTALVTVSGEVIGVASLVQDITERTLLLDTLSKLAIHDELTGLFNRREMNQLLGKELQRSQRFGHPMVFVILDLDGFKSANDHFGHLVGDEVLKWFAQLLRMNIRAVDFPARYGGDEFTIIMPETTSQEAFQIIERLRLSVIANPFLGCQADGTRINIPLSFSLGMAEYPVDAQDQDMVIEKADQALYRAKHSGGNCIVMCQNVKERTS